MAIFFWVSSCCLPLCFLGLNFLFLQGQQPYWIRAQGFPWGSAGKESACNAGDLVSIPGLGRSPGEENDCPLQYSSWRMSWTEESGGTWSMGSQRVRHDSATNTFTQDFRGGPRVKNLPANAGDLRNASSIPELGRSPGGGNGNPLLYLCPENPMDRGVWQAMVCGITKSQTRLSN